ncbi:7-cyano-7-deazaguanine synthase [Desulfofundulus australicus DSM 11792]|uniref:7-cyano-7-deazaguanine synthase n=1 Tax=Desulfofundulus australicus DSM 11792 TaxID=1121425 RepID=A0A1M5C6Y0_9FIRM|nr:7-cyano-7-deazaguanine synthase QueC [Desulfofundulus australicus]SHF50416.1 7-cyano-7-deazaguanine synthase [Desulfofundulus australicus DSM 11792]
MKSVVLLSGGLDSTVSMAQALIEGEVQLCLTIDYGQRAAAKEIAAAQALAAHYNLAHRVISLPFLADVTTTSLVNRKVIIPEPEGELDNPQQARTRAKAVWVPNRNALFINIAACFAEALGCEQVVTGFNREEAAAFPDNSIDFIEAINLSLSYSTANKIRVVSYTARLNKREIVRLGQRLKIPWHLLWSCYYGGETMCGRCESCRRFMRAMSAAR